ncbi:hypothetical protein QJS04_geneDACA001951 [Acorus gramineus]|uniref:Transposase MuDR plant domain-containing protein n=1 Tax=Acorus gramineus TaxID=55184 RepID=A0AAV9A7X2_ACOGR|nr:hypothetical protein QJS04_geneDACA001951 [Acorus gramineus]
MDEAPFKVTFYHGGFWKNTRKGDQKYMYAKQKTILMNANHSNMMTLAEEVIYVSQWAAGHNVLFYFKVPRSNPPKYEKLTTDEQLSKLFRDNHVTRKFSIWLSVEECGRSIMAPKRLSLRQRTESYHRQSSKPKGPPIVVNLDADDEDNCSGEAELDEELGEEPTDPLAMNLVDTPIIPPVGPLADALISVGIGDDYEGIGVNDDGDWEQSIAGYTLDKTKSWSTSSFGDSDQVETSESYHSVPPGSDDSMSEGINEYDGEYMEIDKEAPQIAVGATFKNVEEFRLCLRMHAISKGIEFIFLKNDLLRVTIKCAMHECPRRVHASRLQDGVTFQIKTLHDEHTCINVKKVGSKMASSAWICEKILDSVKSNMKNVTPRASPRRGKCI